LGLAQQPGFQNYHRLLNWARWSACQAAGVLLGLLVEAFVPAGPIVLRLDELLERRRGRKLTGRAPFTGMPPVPAKPVFRRAAAYAG
jgi:hypothetical protein